MSDPLMDRLAALPGADPDAVRTERTRMRCRARVSACGATVAAAPTSHVGRGIWRGAIAVLGVLYLIEAFTRALLVYGRS